MTITDNQLSIRWKRGDVRVGDIDTYKMIGGWAAGGRAGDAMTLAV